MLLLTAGEACYGQSSHGRQRAARIAAQPQAPKYDTREFRIVGGVMREVGAPKTHADSLDINNFPHMTDALRATARRADSLQREGELLRAEARVASMRADSLEHLIRLAAGDRSVAGNALADTLSVDSLSIDSLRVDSLSINYIHVDSLDLHLATTVARADSLVAANPDMAATADSLRLIAATISLTADSLAREAAGIREGLHAAMMAATAAANANAASADTTASAGGETALILSRRDQRRLERAAFRDENDTTHVRYSWLLRDTMPLSRMTLISVAVPGFSQVHNKQAWKVPILYATVGTTFYFGTIQNHNYRIMREQYDDLVKYGADRETSDLDEVQAKMIRYNTNRQLLFGAALATYIYFLGDGAVNHPSPNNHIKKATTLSTLFPGAGQIYNRSYWKVPIVMGSMASMLYVVDWNNRGYQRFRTAYDIVTDGNPDTHSEFWNGYAEMIPESSLANYRNSYRRARDLAIILTGAAYLIQLIDAHVDAHMKSFDISDELAFDVRPSMTNLYTQRAGSVNALGMSLSWRF